MPLREFYRWFVPETWDVQERNNPEATRLTHHIDHLFILLSDHVISPREFKRELDQTSATYVAATTPWHQPVASPVTLKTSAENDITESDAPVMVVQRAPAEAPA